MAARARRRADDRAAQSGTAEENRAKSSEHGLVQVLLQSDREVAEAYNVHATPGAVLVPTDGTIGSAAALGADAVERLVAEATGGPISLPAPTLLHPPAALPMPVTPRSGELAPTLTLPDLDGQLVGLKRFRDRPTLVLFWNPGCGFCARMLDDLKAWEHGAGRDAPQLLVVSTGGSGREPGDGIEGDGRAGPQLPGDAGVRGEWDAVGDPGGRAGEDRE